MIKPDWSKVTPNVVLNALGQGLFSLSLGMGCVITYSSYMKKTENLTRIAIMTIVMDLIFALLAGLVILPSVFAFGFSPDQGPRLLFVVLPQVFHSMPGGGFFAIAFFLIVMIAAITSSISLMEVITSYLTEELKITRKKALVGSGIVLAITGTLCSLSMGTLEHFKLFGLNLFGLFDYLSSNILMPIGAFFIALFVGWKMKKADVWDELSNGGKLKLRAYGLFRFLVRWFVPIGILLIFLHMLQVI
jgi:Na+-dependent transporters of the SNF family